MTTTVQFARRFVTFAAVTALFCVSGAVLAPRLSAQAQAQGRQAGPPPPPDPRVGLKAGVRDAGVAAKGMELVMSLPKPAGFDDPSGTGGLNFANSDIAFQKNLLILGNFNGINFFDVEDPKRARHQLAMPCPGGQGDVSVYGKLMFMSVEANNGRVDCGVAPAAPATAAGAAGAAPAAGRGGRAAGPAADPMRFRGVRIFDISNPMKPTQIAAVQTCRGSHTHTLVPDPKDKANLYIYGSGTAGVRSGEELKGCIGEESDPDTALFSIDVIKVPLAAPQTASVVNRPRIFADPNTGAVSGLWQGGDHGKGTQTSRMTNQCHDITVYPAVGLAAGACSGNGILLDISDPVHPKRLDDVADPSFAYWHSASFNNDGTKVLFTDEWGGGTSPRCRASDPLNWGADAIFNIVDKHLKFAGYYKMPAAQTDQENCVAHNGSLIPVPGRDIKVQAWYQGGASVLDFTDSARPVEIAYFDRGPLYADKLVTGGYWSTYWYNGNIYGSEIARGLDILKLVPTDMLTQNEIDAAMLVKTDELNVQSQPKFVWPASFVVAKAYLDQLARSKAIPAERIAAAMKAISDVETAAAGAAKTKAIADLNAMAAQFNKDAATVRGADSARLRSLASTIIAKNAAK